MLTLHRLPPGVDPARLDRFEDRVFSQRLPWLAFVRSFTGGEIVLAALRDTGEDVGYFAGLRFRPFGLMPVLGSPFRGWTTAYMGFSLAPGIARADALRALPSLAFDELGCLHLELTDRHVGPGEGVGLGFAERRIDNFRSDLTESEDALFGRMTSACRRAIRKGEKCGLRVEEAAPDGFAEEYYAQLREVFARQNLTPTYPLERVRLLIEHVHPSGMLLLARVREPGGRSIATGIYAGFGRLGFLWGNASLREFQGLRPNEALHWFALRYWRQRGMQEFDWGGAGLAGAYKAKYGGEPFAVAALRKSRYRIIRTARDAAEQAYYLPRRLRRRVAPRAAA